MSTAATRRCDARGHPSATCLTTLQQCGSLTTHTSRSHVNPFSHAFIHARRIKRPMAGTLQEAIAETVN